MSKGPTTGSYQFVTYYGIPLARHILHRERK